MPHHQAVVGHMVAAGRCSDLERGAGKWQSNNRRELELFRKFPVAMERKRRLDFPATAKSALLNTKVYPVDVQGYLKSAWLDVDENKSRFIWTNAKDVTAAHQFSRWSRAWQGHTAKFSTTKLHGDVLRQQTWSRQGLSVGPNSPVPNHHWQPALRLRSRIQGPPA